MNTMPIFIRLHYKGVERMINIWNINAIVPYGDTMTDIYVNCRQTPICVDESYEEVKKKLQHVTWFV